LIVRDAPFRTDRADDRPGGPLTTRDGAEPGFDIPPVLADPHERRLTVRILNTWSGLRAGAEHPQMSRVHPQLLGPAADNCVFIRRLDAGGFELAWTGDNLRGEAGLGAAHDVIPVDRIPPSSMIGCLVEHVDACIELAAPLDVESESTSIRGSGILYRGTLLPLAHPDGTIGGLLGAISWKESAPAGLEQELLQALAREGLGSSHG
jgi:hypothetical protein